jgi:hypothetical protein
MKTKPERRKNVWLVVADDQYGTEHLEVKPGEIGDYHGIRFATVFVDGATVCQTVDQALLFDTRRDALESLILTLENDLAEAKLQLFTEERKHG